MDPKQAYFKMIKALRNYDFETARELDSIIFRSNIVHKWELSYVIVCRKCDFGWETGSESQAVAEGWVEIETASSPAQANFYGLCPICRRQQENRS